MIMLIPHPVWVLRVFIAICECVGIEVDKSGCNGDTINNYFDNLVSKWMPTSTYEVEEPSFDDDMWEE